MLRSSKIIHSIKRGPTTFGVRKLLLIQNLNLFFFFGFSYSLAITGVNLLTVCLSNLLADIMLAYNFIFANHFKIPINKQTLQSHLKRDLNLNVDQYFF